MFNKKHLAVLMLAAGGLASSSAFAQPTWLWTGTVADWKTYLGGIVDNNRAPINPAGGAGTGTCTLVGTNNCDGDSTFTFLNNGTGIADNLIGATLLEEYVGNVDFYDVSFSFQAANPNYRGGGSLTYEWSTIGEPLDLAGFRIALGGANGPGSAALSTKKLFDVNPLTNPGATPFLTLSSTDGSDSGLQSFAPRTSFYVVDTYGLTNTTTNYQDSHNAFTIAVPEPISPSLFGIGLAAMAFFRRQFRLGMK